MAWSSGHSVCYFDIMDLCLMAQRFALWQGWHLQHAVNNKVVCALCVQFVQFVPFWSTFNKKREVVKIKQALHIIWE